MTKAVRTQGWARVYSRRVSKGEGQASAALKADEWQEKDRRKRGVCVFCGHRDTKAAIKLAEAKP